MVRFLISKGADPDKSFTGSIFGTALAFALPELKLERDTKMVDIIKILLEHVRSVSLEILELFESKINAYPELHQSIETIKNTASRPTNTLYPVLNLR